MPTGRVQLVEVQLSRSACARAITILRDDWGGGCRVARWFAVKGNRDIAALGRGVGVVVAQCCPAVAVSALAVWLLGVVSVGLIAQAAASRS